MKKVALLTRLIAAASCAAVIAACSSPSTSVVPGGASTLAQRSAADGASTMQTNGTSGTGQLFVAGSRTNVVQIFSKTAPFTLLGQITQGIGGPNGMVVDKSGNLYVANVYPASISVYPPGKTSPSVVYKKDLTNPLNLAMGANGTLYLVNYYPPGHGSAIFEYANGSTTPTAKIQFPNGGAEGVALDSSNNLYVSINQSNGGRILKFAPGAKTGKDLGISLGFAGGLLVDNKGNLVACDQTGMAIDIFPPGATKPSQRITGMSSPYHIAFGENYARLYLADNSAHVVTVYTYPGAKIVGQIQRTEASYGVAVNPPAPL